VADHSPVLKFFPKFVRNIRETGSVCHLARLNSVNPDIARIKLVFGIDKRLPFVRKNSAPNLNNSDLANTAPPVIRGFNVYGDKVIHGGDYTRSDIMGFMSQAVCTIIAGPNGAGKTTFAMKFLPQTDCRIFLNADMIATALSPLEGDKKNLIEAGKIFLRKVEECIEKRENFAFETTLSGKAHLARVKHMLADGWRVNMIFLWIPDAETSLNRVRHRVMHGGHNVPEKDIRRRYGRTLRNLFAHYAPVCSEVECLDSSDEERKRIFRQERKSVMVFNQKLYDKLQREAEMKETKLKESVDSYEAETAKPGNGTKYHIGDIDSETIWRIHQEAIAEELERKRKLGYDAIVVRNDIIMKLHPDGSTTEIGRVRK